MNKPEILNDIKRRINEAGAGSVFVVADFADIAENAKIATSLGRLEDDKIIRRVLWGVYEKPTYNEFLGEFVAPAPDKVAHALARSFGWTIVPCGDTALNLLGLSTQVPSVWHYVSNGTYREYTYDDTTIKFKRTTNKEISKLSPKTALVIQAIRALGKDNVSDETIAKIRALTSAQEKVQMLAEAKYTTSWIYDVIKTICLEKSKSDLNII